MAAIHSLPGEVLEAAELDNCGWGAKLRYIIIPMLRPTILTAVVLLATSVVTSYDLVVAMTGGGPGFSTDLPGKFVVDFLFQRSNLGLASAAAVVMMGSLIAALAGRSR